MNCPHCDTPIDEHEASRCLDAWVAEAVFGGPDNPDNVMWYWWDSSDANSKKVVLEGITGPLFAGPEFSTSIAAAWEVVEKMRADGFYGSVNITSWKTLPWNARFWTEFDARKGYDSCGTAPLAICRAAIKAKGKRNV